MEANRRGELRLAIERAPHARAQIEGPARLVLSVEPARGLREPGQVPRIRAEGVALREDLVGPALRVEAPFGGDATGRWHVEGEAGVVGAVQGIGARVELDVRSLNPADLGEDAFHRAADDAQRREGLIGLALRGPAQQDESDLLRPRHTRPNDGDARDLDRERRERAQREIDARRVDAYGRGQAGLRGDLDVFGGHRAAAEIDAEATDAHGGGALPVDRQGESALDLVHHEARRTAQREAEQQPRDQDEPQRANGGAAECVTEAPHRHRESSNSPQRRPASCRRARRSRETPRGSAFHFFRPAAFRLAPAERAGAGREVEFGRAGPPGWVRWSIRRPSTTAEGRGRFSENGALDGL